MPRARMAGKLERHTYVVILEFATVRRKTAKTVSGNSLRSAEPWWALNRRLVARLMSSGTGPPPKAL